MKTFIVTCGYEREEIYKVKAETSEEAMKLIIDQFYPGARKDYPITVGMFRKVHDTAFEEFEQIDSTDF